MTTAALSRGVRRLAGWLTSGVAPGSILVVTSSWSRARLMEHVSDLALPLGAYEIRVVCEDALAATTVDTHTPWARRGRVTPTVTQSLLRRAVYDLPLPPTLRPPNDPARFVPDLAALFRGLQAAGVTEEDARAWAVASTHTAHPPAAPSASSTVALLSAYAEWLVVKDRFRMADRGDLSLALHECMRDTADTATAVARAWRAQYTAVLLPDAHALSPTTAAAVTTAFLSPGPPPGVPPPPAPAEAGSTKPRHPPAALVSSVHAILQPRLEVRYGRLDAPMTSYWSRVAQSQREGGGSGAYMLTIDTVQPSSPVHVFTRGTRPAEVGSPWLDAIAQRLQQRVPGMAYCQTAVPVAAGGEQQVCSPMLCCGVRADADDVISAVVDAVVGWQGPPASNHHGAGSATPAGAATPPPPPRTIGVVCKSHASAARVHAALAQALEGAVEARTATGGSSRVMPPFTLATDISVRLHEVEEVLMLMSLLRVLADPGDNRALYRLCSSSFYGLSPADLAPFMSRCKVEVGTSLFSLMQQAVASQQGALASTPVPLPTAAHAIMKRVLRDVQAASAAYTRHHSTAAALTSFITHSGLARSLRNGSSYLHEVAATAVASLLRMVNNVERGARMPLGGGSQHGVASNAGSAGAGDVDAGYQALDLPFVVSAVEATVFRDGAMVGLGSGDGMAGSSGAAMPLATGATLPEAAHDDEEGMVDETPLAAGVDAAGGTAPVTIMAGSSLSSMDRVHGVTAMDVIAQVQAGADDAQQQVGGATAAPEPGVVAVSTRPTPLVMVTTMQRACDYEFDVVCVHQASDSSYPGMARLPPLQLPADLVQWRRLLPAGGEVNAAGLATPFPVDAEDHARVQRKRLWAAVGNAKQYAVLLAPVRTASRPLASERRSRFLDEVFGPPPPAAAAAPAGNGASGVSKQPASAGDVALPAPTSAGAIVIAVPKAISHSQFSEYAWCPHRFYLTRRAMVTPQLSASLLYGRAVHASIQRAGMMVMASVRSAASSLQSPAPPLVGTAALAPHLLQAQPALHLLATVADGLPGVGGGGGHPAMAHAAVMALLHHWPTEDDVAQAMHASYRVTWMEGEDKTLGGGGWGGAGDIVPPEWSAVTEEELEAHRRALQVIPSQQVRLLQSMADDAVRSFVAREITAGRAAWAAVQRELAAPTSASAAAATPTLPALVEHGFRLQLPGVPGTVVGIMDRVDVAMGVGGGGARFLIREFKSGAPWKRDGHLRRQGKDSLQVALYHHAFTQLLLPPSGDQPTTSGVAPTITAQMEAVETGEAVPVVVTTSLHAKLLAQLRKFSANLAAGVFTPAPSMMKCGMCPHNDTCQHTHGKVVTAIQSRPPS